MTKNKDLIILNDKNKADTIAEYNFYESKCNVCCTNESKIYSKSSKQNTYSSKDVQFKSYCSDNPDIKKLLDYFSELSNCVGLKNNDGSSILSRQFSRIKLINDEHILGKFFKGDAVLDNRKSITAEIYPFGLNFSQKAATTNALSSCISVIEGPPGTGKTQTILNIIANIVLQNKTVAVVSGNNSATTNVLEK